jgi:hypothetical protein
VRERQSASVSPRVPDCGVRTFVAALLDELKRANALVGTAEGQRRDRLPSAERQVESLEGWSAWTDLERCRVRRRRL